MIKFMLASDWDPTKVRFPVLIQPKIDGVRAGNFDGIMTGRSKKPHANIWATDHFTDGYYKGMDGEMVCGNVTDSDLCRKTTSALTTIDLVPDCTFWVFDYVTDESIECVYEDRYRFLQHAVKQCHDNHINDVQIVPSALVYDLYELEKADDWFLDQGYEGSILRDPKGKYKQGRSTPREGGLLRIKRFVEEDALVLSLIQGESNQNEARIGLNGHTERSTHMANMVANGMVGSLLCRDIKTGQEITVASGCMTHAERVHYWNHQEQLVGETIKYKFFPHGVKDKPRFPTFQSVRMTSDKESK